VSRALASRYQPVLVALHWLLALMIIGLLCLGFFVLANMPNTDPKKLDILVWHMATTGSPLLDRLASIAHHSLYVIVVLMVASGWYTGWLISGVFQHNGETLPSTFAVFPSFQAHATLATLLAILIAAHVAAALYHQFAVKDGLFRRMWFGERTIVPAEK
jgi:cytochrome b561